MIRVIINGASGAMGTILSNVIDRTDDMEVVAGVALGGEGGFYSKLEEYQGPGDIMWNSCCLSNLRYFFTGSGSMWSVIWTTFLII